MIGKKTLIEHKAVGRSSFGLRRDDSADGSVVVFSFSSMSGTGEVGFHESECPDWILALRGLFERAMTHNWGGEHVYFGSVILYIERVKGKRPYMPCYLFEISSGEHRGLIAESDMESFITMSHGVDLHGL